MSVVLMYHALFPDNQTSSIDAEDLPYALSVSDFSRQLDALSEKKSGLYDQSTFPDVVISFDDGHSSNLTLAAPLLQERNLAAYFFITTGFIDNRAYFLSSDELTELSRLPGMCIGSHGVTHRFFDDMSSEESAEELINSREFLENITQSACTSMSFPGGRYTRQTLRQLENAGYTQWFDSEIGMIKPGRLLAEISSATTERLDVAGSSDSPFLKDRWQLVSQRDVKPLERVAIRRNTQMDEFHRIISLDTNYFHRKRLSNLVKHSVRRTIGNRLYHGLYKSFSAR